VSIIAVIDAYDDPANTAFVNRLHDLSRRRAVVHVPASTPGLVDEILRALAGHVPAAGDAGPTVRRRWAAAWIAAYDRLDLVIYGAWRLKEGDLRWLAELVGASPRVRLWLIAYEQADNRPELSAAADTVWSWEQFRDHWHTRIRTQRCRCRRRQRLPRRYSARNVALHVPVAQDPWPWAMSQLLLPRGPSRDLMRAATDITRATKYNADHPLQVALLICELFSYWRTRPQRMFALTVVRNTLFEHDRWLDWEPGLLDVKVAYRAAEPVAHRPSADPADAAEAVIVANAKHLPHGSAFRIGRDGSHVTLQTGETVAITGADRPALRARIAIDGASGTFRHRPLRIREQISQPRDPDRGLDGQALPQITRMLDVRRLHTRADHDAPPLRLDGDVDRRDRLAPAVLDYQHAALLSGLLQWLPPRRPCADVQRRGCDEDTRLLRDLQRYGLVVAGYEGEPELIGWLRSLWCDRRVRPVTHHRSPPKAATIRSAWLDVRCVQVDRPSGR
jgi:hypothetical protein